MANISDKTNLTDHTGVVNESGVAGANWISQINAGGQVYDIATHHGVTFVEGKGGARTTWNGLSDIEVVIPSITDIVQTPIEFAGTVGADGNITWVNGHSAPAKAGNLVFITADCTFNTIACEAGDMAIYDGSKWNVVTGENQVQLVGTVENNKVTVAVGSAKDVLTVEGKTLALTLDYADIMKHTTVNKGDVVDVHFGNMTVGNAYVSLTYAGDQSPMTIGTDINIDKASKLKDGTVNLKNAKGLVNSVNFGTFTPGELPTFTSNSEKTLAVTGGALSATSGQKSGDFVDSVTFGNVTFVQADAQDENKIQMLTGITAGKGNEFLNGIHVTGETETADLTIAGYVAPTKENVQFAEGLVGGLTPVTSISAGDFKLVAGTDLATGFGAESESGDVLSKVTVTANNNTSVLNNAVVNDHVLSFGTTNVTSGVSTEYKYKSLTKTGFEYTAPVATNTAFVTSGFAKVADVKYTFGRDKETTYSSTSAMWKLNTPELSVTKGSYSINHTNMKATVPNGTFIASATQGSLPTLTGYGVETVDITGSVATDLSYVQVPIHTLAADVNTITLPGKYGLTSAESADGDNTVLVGKAGELTVAKGSVDLSGYVTDVKIA